MGMCATELRYLVIRPTLKHLKLWSSATENLLLGTAAQESGLGEQLHTDNRGAIGLYRITPRMHRTIWDNFLANNPELASKIRGLASQREFLQHPHAELATNLAYATAMALMVYMRRGQNPARECDDDPVCLGRCWHNHFHGRPQGSVDEFVKSYRDMVTGSIKEAAGPP